MRDGRDSGFSRAGAGEEGSSVDFIAGDEVTVLTLRWVAWNTGAVGVACPDAMKEDVLFGIERYIKHFRNECCRVILSIKFLHALKTPIGRTTLSLRLDLLAFLVVSTR